MVGWNPNRLSDNNSPSSTAGGSFHYLITDDNGQIVIDDELPNEIKEDLDIPLYDIIDDLGSNLCDGEQ